MTEEQVVTFEPFDPEPPAIPPPTPPRKVLCQMGPHQRVLELGPGGYVFDQSSVLWDELVDGPLPEVTLGGMVRQGADLVFDQQLHDQYTASLAAPVPVQVPMLDAHLVLIEAGHMPAVDAFLDGLTGTDGAKARAYFRVAQTVRRDHELVEVLRQVLGLTPKQIDDLFIVASTLD